MVVICVLRCCAWPIVVSPSFASTRHSLPHYEVVLHLSLPALTLSRPAPLSHSPTVTLTHFMSQGPIISPSTTPRLCELTALRDLFVAQAKAFHVAILSSLTNLTSLSAGPLASAPGEPSLSVLTALTQLQLLELFDVHATQPAFNSLGDWAAVTASQALTRLDLSAVRVEFVGMVFPERRVLPQLVTLMGATVEWLLDRYGLVCVLERGGQRFHVTLVLGMCCECISASNDDMHGAWCL